MSWNWEYFIPGVPTPQGSWVAFAAKHGGKAFAKPSNEKELKAWRKHVGTFIKEHNPPKVLIDGPVAVWCEFQYDRPKARPDDDWKSTAPDVDKLARAMLDSMTNIVYTDDARVVALIATKSYYRPGVMLHLKRLGRHDQCLAEPTFITTKAQAELWQ